MVSTVTSQQKSHSFDAVPGTFLSAVFMFYSRFTSFLPHSSDRWGGLGTLNWPPVRVRIIQCLSFGPAINWQLVQGVTLPLLKDHCVWLQSAGKAVVEKNKNNADGYRSPFFISLMAPVSKIFVKTSQFWNKMVLDCSSPSVELNPALLPLDWLLGSWECDEPGEGCFPTIKPFRYTETLNFSHVGQPVINFT